MDACANFIDGLTQYSLILSCMLHLVHAVLKTNTFPGLLLFTYHSLLAILIVSDSSDTVSLHSATVLFIAFISTVETVDSNQLLVADTSVKSYNPF